MAKGNEVLLASTTLKAKKEMQAIEAECSKQDPNFSALSAQDKAIIVVQENTLER